MTLFDALQEKLARKPAGPDDRDKVAERLAGLDRLSPGDFAVVARRADLLPGAWSAHQLLRELEAEVRAKRLVGER